MLQINVNSTSKQGEYVNFRATLLMKCQKEFEKDKDLEKEMKKRKEVIEETQVWFIQYKIKKNDFNLNLLQNIDKCLYFKDGIY